MTDLEKAALTTYLWWKNRYYAIQNAKPEDNLYSIVSGSPSRGICEIGSQINASQEFLSRCASLADREIGTRSLIKNGKKDDALALMRETMGIYKEYLTANFGQQFIDENEGVFTWL